MGRLGHTAAVITDVEAFIGWFNGVNLRAIRDIAGLPEEALDWRPQRGEGEAAWSVREIVGHIVSSRRLFTGAFAGRGWSVSPNDYGLTDVKSCLALLQRSGEEVAAEIREAGDAALTRRIPSMDDPAKTFTAWRALMLMGEHDVHHRSQIMTYAGLNGWPVQQIFGRTYEEVVATLGASGR